jgi:hypothetical protein
MKTCSSILLLCTGAFFFSCSAANQADVVRANPFMAKKATANQVRPTAANHVFARDISASPVKAGSGPVDLTVTGNLIVNGTSTFDNDMLFADSAANGYATLSASNNTGVFFIQLANTSPVYLEVTDMTNSTTIDHMTYFIDPKMIYNPDLYEHHEHHCDRSHSELPSAPAGYGTGEWTLTFGPNYWDITAVAGLNSFDFSRSCHRSYSWHDDQPFNYTHMEVNPDSYHSRHNGRGLALLAAYIACENTLCIALPCYFLPGGTNVFGGPALNNVSATINITGNVLGISSSH